MATERATTRRTIGPSIGTPGFPRLGGTDSASLEPIIDASPTHARRPLAGLVAAAILATATLVLSVAPVAAAGGAGFVDMANGYRTDSGRTPVRIDDRIDAIAAERADEMAEAGEIGHDFTELRRKFDRAGVCWQGFGEIVARNGSGTFADFGDQWWNSPGHRSVMLGDYTHASGALQTDGERWYAVMIFVKLCNADTAGFSDIRDSKFYDDIVWLVDERITAGCSSTRFCPDGLVTRGQMATFVSRAMDLPSTGRDFFVDDDGQQARGQHQPIRARGDHRRDARRRASAPTASSAAPRWRPSWRARSICRRPTRDWFDDDDGNSHESAINRVAEAGITNGCGPRSYCPSGAVTRGQMAAFLHRAFD